MLDSQPEAMQLPKAHRGVSSTAYLGRMWPRSRRHVADYANSHIYKLTDTGTLALA
jgi:hypothetical protein